MVGVPLGGYGQLEHGEADVLDIHNRHWKLACNALLECAEIAHWHLNIRNKANDIQN